MRDLVPAPCHLHLLPPERIVSRAPCPVCSAIAHDEQLRREASRPRPPEPRVPKQSFAAQAAMAQRNRETALALLERGSVCARDVSRATGTSESVALGVLRRIERDGAATSELVPTGRGIGQRWFTAATPVQEAAE